MALELIDVVARILSVVPKKVGKKDDDPLALTVKLEFSLKASEVLAYFHPSLSGFLYAENGLRFGSGIHSINWREEHSNMQLECLQTVLYAKKLKSYSIVPYIDSQAGDDPEDNQKIWLSCTAIIDIKDVAPSPLPLLCEMINAEMDMTIRPSQLSLLDEEKDAAHG